MLSQSAASKGKGKEVRISLAINRSRSSSATSTPTMSFDIDFIPEDIWLTVFEQLGSFDLGSLSATCHKFHHLTQRPLLREIIWARSASADRNVRDWAVGCPLAPFTGIVRKVKIRLSFKKINQNGAMVTGVDWEFYDAVYHRLLSFTNLRSLELMDTILTPALYPVLAAIPSLRELSVINCTFLWSPLYPAILSELGRPVPQGVVPDSYTVARGTPVEVAAQRQWFIDNHTFDFTTELNHITHLTFKSSRPGVFNDDPTRSSPDDLPYPSSELSKPSILHPLYLLMIPSLTDLTLTWNASLMHVCDILKHQNTTNALQNGGQPGHHQMGHHMHNIATALHSANPFGLNVFVQFRPTFSSINHATLLVDDLSRDMMDSVTVLFEQRLNSPAAGLGPLRTKLRVGKHSLTEQHLGSIQFRLQGVYHYEGPLQVAGLLTAGMNAINAVNQMEEVRMTEAMDMNLVLFTLEKLPRALKRLDVRTYKWDQEILYAVRALFKDLQELVVRYGKGGLRENTHVILGSDILPELKQLHTLRILPSSDCIKREQQRYPFTNHHGGGGGGAGGGGLPYPPGNGTNWWAMSSTTHGQAPHTALHHHHHLFPPPGHNHAPQVAAQDEDDDDDLDDLWVDDAILLSDDELTATANGPSTFPNVGVGRSASSTAAAYGGGSISGASTNGNAGSVVPGNNTGASNLTHAGPSTGPPPTGTTSLHSVPFSNRRGGLRSFGFFGHSFSAVAPVPFSSASTPASTSGYALTAATSSATPAASSSSLASASSAAPSTSSTATLFASRRGANLFRQTSVDLDYENVPHNSVSLHRGGGGSSSAPGGSNGAGSTALATPSRNDRVLSEGEELRRIEESLKEDLADYLVGWNRHCPRLRVVQIEHDVTWVRRFDGDVWMPVKNKKP